MEQNDPTPLHKSVLQGASKQRILSIGGTGLVGSRISELLSSKYQITNFGSSDINITNPDSVKLLPLQDFDTIILFSAKTDVDGCEKDKELKEQGSAWKINVLGAQNIAEACFENSKKLIYISTDSIFDGTIQHGHGYTEDDAPNPQNWYGYTKWQGEKIVQSSGCEYLIIRLAFPYRARFDKKKDFMRTIKEKLENRQEVKAVTDQFFCPTFIDDLANVFDVLIQNNAEGIYHAVGGGTLTPHNAALQIADVFGLEKSLIYPTTREEFFKNRAMRPYNLTLKNDKIESLGVRMKTFEEGLKEIKNQLNI